MNYYTPEIEELYVGYELEWKMKKSNFINFPSNPEIYEWQKHVITLEDFSNHDLANDFHNVTYNLCEFRTPYLSVKDIESLGFVLIQNNENMYFFTKKTEHKYAFDLDFCIESRKVTILQTQDDIEVVLFNSKLKSINELKKLMNWIKLF